MLRPQTALLWSAVLLLAACSVSTGRTDPRLGEMLPATYLEKSERQSTDLQPGPWWHQFHDPVLDRLMDELFAGNLQLDQALARIEQAAAGLKAVSASRRPTLNFEAQAGRSMEPSFAGDFTGNSQSLSVMAAYEIDLWGRLAAGVAAAGHSYRASEEELQTLILGLSAQLADLYYLAVEQRAQLELADQAIRSYRETLERVETRYRLGTVPVVDVYQARQSLTAARSSRHLFAANLANAEHALAVLLGRYPEGGAAGTLALLPPLSNAWPTGLPAELVGRRPDLRAALRRIEAADAEVAAAIRASFPSLNLLASGGRTRRDFATGLIEGNFWSLLADLSAPLYDAGRRRAEVERSRAVVRERVAAYQQAALTAFREVEDALASGRETERRVAALEEAAAATAATLRLTLDRYLQGVTDYLPVLSAQRADFELQSRLLSARRELIAARISLVRALGGDWMEHVSDTLQTHDKDSRS